MFKKSVCVITSLILIMLSFCGCFGRGKANKSFAVPIIGEPTSLDPQIAKTDSEKMIVLNCYEGLFRINIFSNIKLILAVLVSMTALILAVSVPQLQVIFETVTLTREQLLTALGLSAVIPFVSGFFSKK